MKAACWLTFTITGVQNRAKRHFCTSGLMVLLAVLIVVGYRFSGGIDLIVATNRA